MSISTGLSPWRSPREPLDGRVCGAFSLHSVLGADSNISPIPFETLLVPFLTRIAFQRTPRLRARILCSSVLGDSKHFCFNDGRIAPKRAIDSRVHPDSVSDSVEPSSDEENQPKGLTCSCAQGNWGGTLYCFYVYATSLVRPFLP
jgi:hypothetical protein